MKKLALALILLALPCCKWGTKDNATVDCSSGSCKVVDTYETAGNTGKEVVTADVEEAGYAEEPGYGDESRAS